MNGPADLDQALTSVAGDAQAIIDTATRAAGPHPITDGTVTAFVVPAGGDLHVHDDREKSERFLDAPRRTKGTTILLHPVSFIAFAEAIGGAVMYADIVGCRTITAIFNGPTRSERGWADHRAVLNLTPTESWRRWAANDRKMGEQVAFAQHIEDNLDDIVDPPGAEMLEMAQSFEAAAKVDFKEANRLANGQRQFLYHETVTARAGEAGTITVPESFLLSLAPFEGAEKVEVGARLRYAIREGKLSIGYVLDRPDKILKAAFEQVLATIEDATQTTAYLGSPAS